MKCNVTYTIVCINCALAGNKVAYVGESQRSYAERQGEHRSAINTGNRNYAAVCHHLEQHPGKDMHFGFRLNRQHRSSLERQISEALLMETLEVDTLMNSKAEWGFNQIPRASYTDDSRSLATPAGNSTNSSNRNMDKRNRLATSLSSQQVNQNSQVSQESSQVATVGNTSKKRSLEATEATESSFSSQFSQRRLRRRLEKNLMDEQQGGNTGPTYVAANRDCLATAQKWRAIHEGKTRKQHAGNKVLDKANQKKCVRNLDGNSQRSIKFYIKRKDD